MLDALWDLVWRGLVTNDTFAPLRALAQRGERRRRPGRAAPTAAAGRWSRVADLVPGAGEALAAHAPADATRRAHARALLLLER